MNHDQNILSILSPDICYLTPRNLKSRVVHLYLHLFEMAYDSKILRYVVDLEYVYFADISPGDIPLPFITAFKLYSVINGQSSLHKVPITMRVGLMHPSTYYRPMGRSPTHPPMVRAVCFDQSPK